MRAVLGVVRGVKEGVLGMERVHGLRHGMVHGVLLVQGCVDLVCGGLNVADGTVWQLLASMRIDDGSALESGRLCVLQGGVDDGCELSVLLESGVLCYLDGIGALCEQLRNDIDVVGLDGILESSETGLVTSINVERRLFEEGADELNVAVLGRLEKSGGHDGVRVGTAGTVGRAHQSLTSTVVAGLRRIDELRLSVADQCWTDRNIIRVNIPMQGTVLGKRESRERSIDLSVVPRR